MEPLHADDPAAEVQTAGGMVRNLTAEEYAATYATGEPHQLPDGVLAAVAADTALRAEQ